MEEKTIKIRVGKQIGMSSLRCNFIFNHNYDWVLEKGTNFQGTLEAIEPKHIVTRKVHGGTNMTYDANKPMETEAGLPAGLTADGVITIVKDGKSKDFISNPDKWMGDVESSAIELTINVKHDNKDFIVKKLFTYKLGTDGSTEFNPKSNLGKYFKFYKKLPQVNDIVRNMTNSDGFWRVIIE